MLSKQIIERRTEEREVVRLEAALRRSGAKPQNVLVGSLSPRGCALAPARLLAVGDRVWVRLPNTEAWAGEVAWREKEHVGISFDQPLHPAVVDRIAISS